MPSARFSLCVLGGRRELDLEDAALAGHVADVNVAAMRPDCLSSDFIAILTDAATLEASARGRTLTVAPVEIALTIEVDQKVLSAVVVNLLQNAFKFSPPNSMVTLTVGASADRVLIEVEDECGGLPGGQDLKELFRPFDEQRGADRTGVGIGLAFCRWGAEANNGRLYARNLPGKGCTFTVDLPRSPALAAKRF